MAGTGDRGTIGGSAWVSRSKATPFRNLLTILEGTPKQTEKLLGEIEKQIPSFGHPDREYLALLLASFVSLVSEARVQGPHKPEPLVQVRYQLWLRELRRMVSLVGPELALAFAGDLKPEQLQHSHRGILLIDGDGTDRVGSLAVEDRSPGSAVVAGFPDAAGSLGDQVMGGVVREYGELRDTSRDESGPDIADAQAGERAGVNGVLGAAPAALRGFVLRQDGERKTQKERK